MVSYCRNLQYRAVFLMCWGSHGWQRMCWKAILADNGAGPEPNLVLLLLGACMTSETASLAC